MGSLEQSPIKLSLVVVFFFDRIIKMAGQRKGLNGSPEVQQSP